MTNKNPELNYKYFLEKKCSCTTPCLNLNYNAFENRQEFSYKFCNLYEYNPKYNYIPTPQHVVNEMLAALFEKESSDNVLIQKAPNPKKSK